MQINVSETLRYLGAREADAALLRLIEDCGNELLKAAEPAFSSRSYISQISDETSVLGDMAFKSRDLAERLRGCFEVTALAATLGAGVDRLLRRYSVGDMSKSVIVSAAASALIEDFIDEALSPLIAEKRSEGLFARERFSPGYGDLSLEYQRDILVLSEARRIGIALSDGNMMIPVKSVSAFIGFSSDPAFSGCRNKCGACDNKDCLFRKD